MSEHGIEKLGHDLKKALHDAQSFRAELSEMRTESSSTVAVNVTGTIGGGSGLSACTVDIKGDHVGDAARIATKLKKEFPNADCSAEKDKAVTCTL